MDDVRRSPARSLHPADAVLPGLVVLFVGSGCAALVYEVVWFQLLQLSIGSSAVSLAVILGTFMGGMGLGSLLAPRLLDRARHPLAVYAWLELGIALCGLVVLHAAPWLGGLYDRVGPSGFAGLVGRGLVAACCLLPPTMLMGATLPAIARWVEATPRGVAWLGWFYGGNIAGAVAGCLLAGFVLLRDYDAAVASHVAVGINIAVALVALAIARRLPRPPRAAATTGGPLPVGTGSILVTIALSGFTALAAEVVWTRLLAMLFGATVYTLSLILAVFLGGLGIGSVVGATLARDAARPRDLLAGCQALLTLAIAWAAWQISVSLPVWPINPSLAGDPWIVFQLDMVRTLWVVLPAAALWGASFPLAIAAVARGDEASDPGRIVAAVSAANTAGAIGGALGATALVWYLGSQRTQQLLIAVAGLAGLVALLLASPAGTRPADRRLRAAAVVAMAAAAVGAVPPVSGLLVAYGRYAATWQGYNEIVYVGEGLQASVAVTRTPEGVLNYHNAGKVQASSEPQDMRLQRLLGHLTTLLPADPRRVLVIGCGAGVTAGAAALDPRVESETIVEIEPLVPRAVSTHFGAPNHHVVTNPKVTVTIDDARHYLLTTRETFDAITSDPLDPWVKGAATLYTREFFDVVKSRLAPGGVFTLFVQLYESSPAAVKSEIGTFLEAFPDGVVFANTQNGRGYDLVLVGGTGPLVIDVDALATLLAEPRMEPVAASLREVGLGSAVELLATFAGRKADLATWLADATINHDRTLRLQWLAGLGLNTYSSGPIYEAMLAYPFRYPEELFRTSPDMRPVLEQAIRAEQAKTTGPKGGR